MPSNNAISHEERLSRMQLSLSENIGPAIYLQLMEVYGSAENALLALPDIAARSNAPKRIKLHSRDQARQYLENTLAEGGTVITLGEPDYPALLAEITTAPPILYVSGQASALNQPCCGILGSRNSSANGKRFAREIAADLATAGWMTVSGLARGIDTAAHEASLNTGTVGVIATGLDISYPVENAGYSVKSVNWVAW